MKLPMDAAIRLAMLTMLGVQAGAPPPLQVSHRARALAPGEAVIVEVRSRDVIDDVSAEWLGQRVVFSLVGENTWQGIAAIDLAAKAGPYAMAIRARTPAGAVLTRSYPLAIASRTFPVRKLSVDAKYAAPSAESLARIQRELRTVEEIFARPPSPRQWTAPFAAPVPGVSTSSFGRRSVVNGEPRSPHSGMDFQAANGTPVEAPNRGTVRLAADHYFAGRIVIVDHGASVYSYLAHLSEIDVKEGDVVERGQRVGLSGSTGRVTGPHLHWTLRIGKARVDPLSLIFATSAPREP
jgi:murein DD-endopeptidase MepM/ murein hydrolase activator NlpD